MIINKHDNKMGHTSFSIQNSNFACFYSQSFLNLEEPSKRKKIRATKNSGYFFLYYTLLAQRQSGFLTLVAPSVLKQHLGSHLGK